MSSSPLAAQSSGRWLPGKSCCSKSRACYLSNQLSFTMNTGGTFPCLLRLISNCNFYSANDLLGKKVQLSGNGWNSRLVTASPAVGGAQLRLGAAISLFLSTFWTFYSSHSRVTINGAQKSPEVQAKLCGGWILTSGAKDSVLITIIICPWLLLLGTFALTVVNGRVDKRGFGLSLRHFNFARKTWTRWRLVRPKLTELNCCVEGRKRKTTKLKHKSDICHLKICSWAILSTPETTSIMEDISSTGKCWAAVAFCPTSWSGSQFKTKYSSSPNSWQGNKLCLGWSSAIWTAHPRKKAEWSVWFLFHYFALKNFD